VRRTALTRKNDMSNPARIHFRDAGIDGQLARSLSLSTVHAADLGEVLATARRLTRPTRTAWWEEWSQTAATAERSAAEALEGGDRTSARRALLRASEYHRQSYYFLRSDLDDPRLLGAHDRHVATFQAAVALMDHPATYVQIPCPGGTVNGYLFSPDDSGDPRPTIVFPAGYDSTAQSWADAPGALARDYNAFVLEGPGQGEVLYRQRLFLVPEWERVLTPVLDWLSDRPEVDAHGIVVVGRSLGGYLAPRAAAFDHRIAALVCDPAQPRMAARIPGGLVGRVAAPLVRTQMRISESRAEFFGARMAVHGIHEIGDYFAELRRFDMCDVAHQITCPTLIVEAENDFAGGDGALLQELIGSRAQLIRLTAAQGADGHCAGIGQETWAGTVYPWLHRTLAASRAGAR
jgi:hypothetical protein